MQAKRKCRDKKAKKKNAATKKPRDYNGKRQK